MKTKFLSVAMAVVMSVVCLTGCSGSGNFSKDAFISAAKNNGLKAVEDPKELTSIAADPGKTKAMYYDVEDFQIIQYLNTTLSDISMFDVKEFVYASESIGKTDDHGSCLTTVCFVTVKDSKTAEEIYKTKINSLKLMKPEDGVKNGVTYTIGYLGPDDSQHDNSTVELAYGIYLKGNQIVWMRSDYYSTMKNNTVEGFCKSLGLVSPYTLS